MRIATNYPPTPQEACDQLGYVKQGPVRNLMINMLRSSETPNAWQFIRWPGRTLRLSGMSLEDIEEHRRMGFVCE